MKNKKKVFTSLMLSLCLLTSVGFATGCDKKDPPAIITSQNVSVSEVVKTITVSDSKYITQTTDFSMVLKNPNIVDGNLQEYYAHAKSTINTLDGEYCFKYKNGMNSHLLGINQEWDVSYYLLQGNALSQILGVTQETDYANLDLDAYYKFGLLHDNDEIFDRTQNPQFAKDAFVTTSDLNELALEYDTINQLYLDTAILDILINTTTDIEKEYIIKRCLIENNDFVKPYEFAQMCIDIPDPTFLYDTVYSPKTIVDISAKTYSDGNSSILLTITNQYKDYTIIEILEYKFKNGLIVGYNYNAEYIQQDIVVATTTYTTTVEYNHFEASLRPELATLKELVDKSTIVANLY